MSSSVIGSKTLGMLALRSDKEKGALPGVSTREPLSYRFFRNRSTILIADQIPARMVAEAVMIVSIIVPPPFLS